MYHQSGSHSGPPPICFNCNKEGHFVVDCPTPKRTSIGGLALGVVGQNPSSGSFSGTPAPLWTNSQSMGAPEAAFTNYSKPPPVVTRYTVPPVPGQAPLYGNSPAPYGPSPTTPLYQSAPPVQNPPSQSSYPTSQFIGSASVYSQKPAPQPYNSPSPNSQYQGYQPPTPTQFPPGNTPPFYSGSPGQQFGPPAPQHQSPVRQYTPTSNSYSGPPPPQWNNTTPASAYSPFNAPSQQTLNLQSQCPGGQREYSGTPSQLPQQQQTPHIDYGPGSDLQHQRPQTPTSALDADVSAPIRQVSQANGLYAPMSTSASVASSRASTPYGRYGSISSASGKQKAPLVSVKASPGTPTMHVPEPISLAEEATRKEAAKQAAKKEAEEGEEGEYTEEDLLQEQFNWEYKKIFKEPEPTEFVALSQPLSYTYTVTPVPLMDPRWSGSVSRYARKENLKEYLKPIRSQPQWDYLKEDPAFSDVKLEGPLILLKDVREWMAQRHGVSEAPQSAEENFPGKAIDQLATSRKRSWTNEQEDVDNQIQLEASVEQSTEQPNKRQKNEGDQDNCIFVDASGTPAPGTPTIGGAGTPTFGVADDVWAPEPGEVASAPMDPTEALLASLGVSGMPKPVREESNPPLATSEDDHANPNFGGIPRSMSPQAHNSSSGTPHNNAAQHKPPNMPPNMPLQSSQGPQQNLPGYGNPQYNTPQQSSPPNVNPYGTPPPHNAQYYNHGIPVYNNSLPPHPNTNYGPPQQYVAPYGPPASQHQPSYGNNQYGPPQGPYPPQGQYGPPQNQYPPPTQYNGPPNNQYGPPQPQWNAPTQSPFHGPPQNHYISPQSQYGLPQNQYNAPPLLYGPPQGQYGAQPQSQYGPPQGQYSPPQNQHANGYPPNQGPPQGPPQYGNPAYAPQGNPKYVSGPQEGNPQQGNPQYFNGLQESHPPSHQFSNQSTQPPRQDSGYASARGSYSNAPALNGFDDNGIIQQGLPQGQVQTDGKNTSAKLRTDGSKASPPQNDPATWKKKGGEKAEENAESEDFKANEPESPLSPTSAEILGKLTQPSKPRKIIRVISGKNKDASRAADESPAKKLKRPAPVVAEAYSRRW